MRTGKLALYLVLLEDSQVLTRIEVGTEIHSDVVELANKSVSDFICRALDFGLSTYRVSRTPLIYNKLFDSVSYLTIRDRYLGIINIDLDHREFTQAYDLKSLILTGGVQRAVDVIIHRLNLLRRSLRKYQALANQLVLEGRGEA